MIFLQIAKAMRYMELVYFYIYKQLTLSKLNSEIRAQESGIYSARWINK